MCVREVYPIIKNPFRGSQNFCSLKSQVANFLSQLLHKRVEGPKMFCSIVTNPLRTSQHFLSHDYGPASRVRNFFSHCYRPASRVLKCPKISKMSQGRVLSLLPLILHRCHLLYFIIYSTSRRNEVWVSQNSPNPGVFEQHTPLKNSF